MSAILKLVGGRIKDIRKERGLSQDQLGEKCEFHFSYIGGVERGERNLSIENLAKIADALDVETQEILNFEQHFGEDKEQALKDVVSLLSKRSVQQIKMARNVLAEIFASFHDNTK